MAQNTLEDIIAKVRLLTARPSPQQITDDEIINYVNSFYVYDMPESMKIEKLKDVYTFQTTPNVDTYTLDRDLYFSSDSPVYIGGYPVDFYKDNEAFYNNWPRTSVVEAVATGDGGAGPYTGTISATPFLRSVNAGTGIAETQNVLFTANITGGSTTAIDDGIGGFLAPAAGTIDYSDGTFSVTFPNAVDAGNTISAQVYQYSAARPSTVLYFRGQFVMRPVPDMSYTVEVNTFRLPTDLVESPGTPNSPELKSMWELLAFGASRKILVDNADFSTLQAIQPFFEEQLLLLQRRTIANKSKMRTSTIYSTEHFNNNFYPYI